MGDNGIASKARDGAQNYQNAVKEEMSLINTLLDNVRETNPTPPGSANTTYTVGQTVTLGGEDFYVIEDSDVSTPTVKLLAKINVITTEGDENRYKQDESANSLAFDSTSPYSNDYATSDIKLHVEAYKTAVEGRMGAGKTIQEARLMTNEEVVALGGDIENKTTSGCTGTTAFVNETRYWLGSPDEEASDCEWYVDRRGRYLQPKLGQSK